MEIQGAMREEMTRASDTNEQSRVALKGTDNTAQGGQAVQNKQCRIGNRIERGCGAAVRGGHRRRIMVAVRVAQAGGDTI